MKGSKQINFIPSDKEMKILEDYCEAMELSKTAVLRELIRRLGEETAARAFGGKLPPETSLAKAAESSQGGHLTATDKGIQP